MSKKKFTGNISGKGYYIALVLCAVAIGVTGYVYYRNSREAVQLDTPGDNTLPVLSTEDGVEAVATEGKETKPTPTTPTEEGKTPVPSSKRVKPVSGDTAMPYSMDALCYNPTTRDWRVHDGVDIAAQAGTAVCAAADGTVYAVYSDEKMGMTVVLHHQDGYITEYASLDENVQVTPGDTVTAGQVIGCVGSTALMESAIGDHVHFTVSCNGAMVDPLDFLE